MSLFFISWSPIKMIAFPVPITALPTWVIDIPIQSDSINLKEAAGGVAYLLLAKQVNVESTHLLSNVTMVKKIINRVGLEEGANIAINYDHSWGSLFLHKLILIRQGKTIDALHSSRMEISQSQSQADNNLYDNVKTLHIILNDVQVGDVIEYSYTISSSDPFLLKPFASTLHTEAAVPIEHLYIRYLLPISKKIVTRTGKAGFQPRRTFHDGTQEYRWDQWHVPPIKKGTAPNYFFIYEQSSWAEINNLYLPWFQIPPQLSPQLLDQIHQLDHETTAEKLVTMLNPSALTQHQVEKVLSFVQNQIRYTGIEMGRSNYQPSNPSKVYARRYGDCKDKALLMVTMLHQLGIEAYVALVSTEQKAHLIQEPPLADFDHAIVLVKINDRSYWLDPTRYYQSSNLDHVYLPDYGYALILGKNTTALTRIVPANNQKPEIKVDELYDLSQDIKKPLSYTIISHYSSQEADRVRSFIAATNLSEIQTRFGKYTLKYYPHLHTVKPLEIQDDLAKNILTIKEYYEINQLWTYNKNKDETEADIIAFIINDYLKKIEDQEGSRRVEVDYPLNVEDRIILKMPYPWPVKPTKLKTENAYFIFNQEIYVHDNFIYWINHYSSKKDSVSSHDFTKYNHDIDQIRDNLVQTVFIKGNLKNESSQR